MTPIRADVLFVAGRTRRADFTFGTTITTAVSSVLSSRIIAIAVVAIETFATVETKVIYMSLFDTEGLSNLLQGALQQAAVQRMGMQLLESIQANPVKAITEGLAFVANHLEVIAKSDGAKKLRALRCQMIGEQYRCLTKDEKLPPAVAAQIICNRQIDLAKAVRNLTTSKS